MLSRQDTGEEIPIVVIYSVSTNMVLRILRCESEVSSMCTPGDDGILICGTILGSLNLYDLNEFDSSMQRTDALDYDALLAAFHPDLA